MNSSIINNDASHNLFTLTYAERPKASSVLACLNGPSTHESFESALSELYTYIKIRILDCADIFMEWVEDKKPNYLSTECSELLGRAEYALERLCTIEGMQETIDWYFDLKNDEECECFYKIDGFTIGGPSDPIKESLISLVSDVQATGGIIEFSDGLSAPSADPTWTDLGNSILKAHTELEKAGVEIRLTITDADCLSSEAEEYH
jgi:hypothetical protein